MWNQILMKAENTMSNIATWKQIYLSHKDVHHHLSLFFFINLNVEHKTKLSMLVKRKCSTKWRMERQYIMGGKDTNFNLPSILQ